MKILICGAGNVGLSIASYLEKTNNDVTLIDQSPDLAIKLSERMDIQAVTGFASDPKVLQQAGATDANMIIAVTPSDEVNMIICEVAHAVFQIPKKIARVRNQAYLSPEWDHLFEEKNLSVDVAISPEIEIAKAINRGLSIAGAFSVTPMVEGNIQIVGTKCVADTPIVNTPISHITGLFPESKFVIAAIYRDSQLIIPDDKERLLVGDDVYFVCAKSDLHEAMRAFGHYQQTARQILLLGAGNIGSNLAAIMEDNELSDINVRIVEKSPERALEVAKILKKAEVLQGDALAIEVLQEANVANTETVVAITQDDKVNVLASLLAKQVGAKRALALINTPETIPLVKSLGIDSVIDPREITVSSILRHVRRGFINSVFALRNNLAEILEAEVTEKSSLLGSTLHDINVPKRIKLVGISREGEMIFPTDNVPFQLRDRLVIISMREDIQEVEKLFSARLEYF